MEGENKKSADYLEGFYDGSKAAFEIAGKCTDDADKLNFDKGYAQAKRELALTWEDIRDIRLIIDGMLNENQPFGLDGFYQEALRRFEIAKRS